MDDTRTRMERWFVAVTARDKEAVLAVIREKPILFRKGSHRNYFGDVAEQLVDALVAEGRLRWVAIDERDERLEAV